MYRIVRTLLRILSNLIFKDTNRIVFMSNPDFFDNARALFDHLRLTSPELKCTWLCKNKISSTELKNMGVSSLVERSFQGFWEFSRAGVIITSHGNLLPLKSKRQIYVNLWHGIALKAIGHMDKESDKIRLSSLNDKNSITISTSKTVSTVLGACFHVNASHIFVTGLPRNDDLFHPVSDDKLSGLLGCDVKRYKKIVFYMPTFRQGYLERTEGKTLEKENIFRFEKFNLKAFQDYLARENILIICKLHPFEERIFASKLSEFRKSLLLLTSDTLINNNVSLYSVISRSELLITDYSSVYTDFLLLDRPLVFVSSDLSEYSEKRGFMLEPYDFWTPGPKATSQNQLQNEISRSLKEPSYYSKEREIIRSIVHEFNDANSSKRVADIIFKKLNRSLNSANN